MHPRRFSKSWLRHRIRVSWPKPLRELDRIERSLFMIEWYFSPALRRCQAGLNKVEAAHKLKRAVFFHERGESGVDHSNARHSAPVVSILSSVPSSTGIPYISAGPPSTSVRVAGIFPTPCSNISLP
ncbi:hypothetical protein BQ8482_530040 [Mesorhizobium delmotii]|uniref:Tn3 transposase DDE domain-containing protein n=1 Tax=Mesorhizobium delmotii TaxID=1631247 RepID=A0A2P9AUL1_9HYPH|nr:hypothetical protein BQ8482_530040 [Mesorhizobium delmotii]